MLNSRVHNGYRRIVRELDRRGIQVNAKPLFAGCGASTIFGPIAFGVRSIRTTDSKHQLPIPIRI